jgi:hypothetical protein
MQHNNASFGFSAFPLLGYGVLCRMGQDSLKAFSYRIKAALTITFIQKPTIIAYALTTFGTAVGNPFITGTSANGAGNLGHIAHSTFQQFSRLFFQILHKIFIFHSTNCHW